MKRAQLVFNVTNDTGIPFHLIYPKREVWLSVFPNSLGKSFIIVNLFIRFTRKGKSDLVYFSIVWVNHLLYYFVCLCINVWWFTQRTKYALWLNQSGKSVKSIPSCGNKKKSKKNHASYCLLYHLPHIYHRYRTPCSTMIYYLNDLPKLIEYVLSQTPFPWVNRSGKSNF